MSVILHLRKYDLSILNAILHNTVVIIFVCQPVYLKITYYQISKIQKLCTRPKFVLSNKINFKTFFMIHNTLQEHQYNKASIKNICSVTLIYLHGHYSCKQTPKIVKIRKTSNLKDFQNFDNLPALYMEPNYHQLKSTLMKMYFWSLYVKSLVSFFVMLC